MSSPRGFGLPHLSEDAVAAFADGVLSVSAAGRARRHCAECAECAGAVRVQREAAMMLRTSPAPALPSGLLDRLAGLPMSTPLPPPRSGLPTVLGADGNPMFVAHDVHLARLADEHRARLAEEQQARLAGEQQAGGPADPGRPHRRGALPVTVLASAAAVVAAGTFGGHVSTLASSNRPTPAGAAQVAGALTGGRDSAGQSAAGQNASRQNPTGQNATGQNATAQAAGRTAVLRTGSLLGSGTLLDAGLPATGTTASTRPIGHRGLPLPLSVTVAPAPEQPHAGPAAPAPRTLPAGHGSTMAGAPAATP